MVPGSISQELALLPQSAKQIHILSREKENRKEKMKNSGALCTSGCLDADTHRFNQMVVRNLGEKMMYNMGTNIMVDVVYQSIITV